MSESAFYFIKNRAVGQNPCTLLGSQKPDRLAGKHEDLESTGKCSSKEQVVPSQTSTEQLSSPAMAAKKRSRSKGDNLDDTKNRKTSTAPFKNILLVKRPVKQQEPAIYGQNQVVLNQNTAEQLTKQLPCSKSDKLDDTQNKKTSFDPFKNILLVKSSIKHQEPSIDGQKPVVLNQCIAEQSSSCDPVTNRLPSGEIDKLDDSKNKNSSIVTSRKIPLSVNGPIERPQPAGDDGLKSSVQFQCSSPVQELVIRSESDKTSTAEHSSYPVIIEVGCSEGVQDEDIAIEPSKTTTGRHNECPVCGKVFSSVCTLKRHISKLHPDESGIQWKLIRRTLRKSEYSCRVCSSKFNFLCYLECHERKFHNLVSDTKNIRKTGKPVAEGQEPVVAKEQSSSFDNPRVNKFSSSETDELGVPKNKNTSTAPFKDNLLLLVNSAVTQGSAGDGQEPVVANQTAAEQLSSFDAMANRHASSETDDLLKSGVTKNKNTSIAPSKNILLLLPDAVKRQQPAGDSGFKGSEKCSIPAQEPFVGNESGKTSTEYPFSSSLVTYNVPCSGGESNTSEIDKNAVDKPVFLLIKNPGSATPVCLQAIKQPTENGEERSAEESVSIKSGNPPSAGKATFRPILPGISNEDQSNKNTLNNKIFLVVQSPSIEQNTNGAICLQKGNQVMVPPSGLITNKNSNFIQESVVHGESPPNPADSGSESDDILFESIRRNEHVCHLCSITFCNLYNMKRHIRKFHADKLEIPSSTRTFKYHCSVCSRRFNSSNHLTYHEKKFHNIDRKRSRSIIQKCPVCSNSFERGRMAEHLETDHEIALKEECFSCKTYEEFLSWKSNIETETNAYFVKRSGSTPNNPKTWGYYTCHRSGKFVCKGKGKRKLKRQGSWKINAFCPAAVRMRKDKNGAYVVTYQSVHLGHSDEPRHLPLKEEERKYVASKLEAGLSLKDILEDIRRDFPRQRHERLHLLNRKDLHNIRRCYGITVPLAPPAPRKKATKIADQFATLVREVAEQSTDGSDDFQLDGDPCETENYVQEEVPPTAQESSASIERRDRLIETFVGLVRSASSSELELLENGVLSLDSQLAIYRQEISDAVSGIFEISSAPIQPKKREPVLKRRGVRCRTSPVKRKVVKASFNNPWCTN